MSTFPRHLPISLYLLLFLTCTCTSLQAENAISHYQLKNLLRHKIAAMQQLVQNPQLIEEVRKHNARDLSLEEIQHKDSRWQDRQYHHEVAKQMYQSAIGRRLRALVELNDSIYSEIFLTDNRGANIASWPITTDYWQGDEAKWINCFNNGKGDIYIGELEFDDSSHNYAVQISVPVLDNSQAIGVLIAGIKLSYLQAKYLQTLK